MEPTTNQLQLGQIEPNPVQDVGVEVVPMQALNEEEVPLFVDGDAPVFQPQPLVTPIEGEQKEELRALLYAASGDSKFYSDPLAFTPQFFGEHVKELVDQLRTEDEVVRRQALMQVLSDPDLDVTGRVEIASSLYNEGYDASMVERHAMVRLAQAQAANEPADVAEETVLNAALSAEDLPTEILVDTPAYGDTANYYDTSLYALTVDLQAALQEMEEGERGLDIAGTMLPTAYTSITSEIAGILDMPTEKYSAWVAQGTAIRNMAMELEARWLGLESGNPEGRAKFAEDVRKVVDVLKNNSGVLGNGNNTIAAQLLVELFPRIFTNEFANAPLEARRKEELLEDAERRIASAQRRIEIGIQTNDPGLRRQAEQELEAARADSVAARVRPGKLDITFNEFLGNFGAIDDLLLFGGMASELGKLSIRAGRRWLGRNIVNANRAAPEITINSVVRGLTTDDTLVMGVTVDKADLLRAVLPSTTLKESIDAAVNALPAVVRLQDEALRRAEANMGYQFYTDGERAAAVGEITEAVIKGTDAAPAALNLSGSTVSLLQTAGTTKEVLVQGVFGATSSSAFSSAKAAINAARKTFGSDANVRVLKYEAGDGGKLVDVAEGAGGKGKFYFSVDTKIPYEAATNVNQRLAYGEGAIKPGYANRAWWSLQRGKARLTFNPLSYMGTVFDKAWTARVNAAGSQELALKEAFTKQVQTAMDMVGGIELEAVNSLLRRGAFQSKTWTPAQLRDELAEGGYTWSQAIEDSYYAFRRGADTLYDVADQYTRKRLVAEGFQEISGPLGRIGFGKAASVPKESITVFDGVTNAHIRMSPSELRAAQADGKMLYELDRPILRAGDETSYVLTGAKVEVRALPSSGVLPRVEGWIPRIYQQPYILYGVKNGKEEVVGTAATEADAAIMAERLRSEIGGGKWEGYENFGFRTDARTNNIGDTATLAADMLNNLGGTVFGQRTAHRLINASEDLGDNMVEPIEALIRGADAVSYQVTKGDMIRQMEERAFAYARAAMAGEPKANLVTLEDYIEHFRSMGTRDSKTGKDWRKRADVLSSVVSQVHVMRSVPDTMAIMVETVYKGLESAFARAGMNAASGWAARQAMKKNDPILNPIMQLSHFTAVATNVLGQALMQTMQPFVLLGTVGPVALQRGYTGAMAVGLNMALQESGGVVSRGVLKTLAYVSGMTLDELNQLTNLVRSSGILPSVLMDTRVSMRAKSRATEMSLARLNRRKGSGMTNARIAKLANMAKDFPANSLYMVERAGFSTMEQANQMVTMATLFARDKGSRRISSRKYQDELIGATREMTGSMVPESSYGFQRGIFKPMFQFVSFPMKMMQLALPAALGGNRSLSGMQKAGMGAAQFLLYGELGVPFLPQVTTHINDYVLENKGLMGEDGNAIAELWMSEPVQIALQGFLIDYAVNTYLQTNVDENINLAISQRLAPMGGTQFAVDKFTAPFLDPSITSFVDMWLGIPGTKASAVGDYIGQVYDIALARARDLDTVPFEDRVEQIGKEGLAMFVSQYRREYVMDLADAMDGVVMRGGRISQERIHEVERIAFSAFGIDTKDRQAYYALRDAHRSAKRNMDRGGRANKAQEYADQYFEQLIRANAMWHDDALPQDRIRILRDDWVGQQNLLASVIFEDDPEMLALVTEQINGKVLRILEQDSLILAEQHLVDSITADLKNNLLENPAGMINRLMHNKSVTDAQKAQVEFVRAQLFEQEEYK